MNFYWKGNERNSSILQALFNLDSINAERCRTVSVAGTLTTQTSAIILSIRIFPIHIWNELWRMLTNNSFLCSHHPTVCLSVTLSNKFIMSQAYLEVVDKSLGFLDSHRVSVASRDGYCRNIWKHDWVQAFLFLLLWLNTMMTL